MTLYDLAIQEALLSFASLGFSIGYDNPKKAMVAIMGARFVVYVLTAIRLYQGA